MPSLPKADNDLLPPVYEKKNPKKKAMKMANMTLHKKQMEDIQSY
jgi:hypothetical protein